MVQIIIFSFFDLPLYMTFGGIENKSRLYQVSRVFNYDDVSIRQIVGLVMIQLLILCGE